MKNQSKILNQDVIYGLIFLAVISRLLPHPANFAAIGGLALFTGAKLPLNKFWIPMLAMLISDLFLGFHSTMIFVYFSFTLIFLIGRLITNKQKWQYIGLGSVSGSILFFVVTNFGVWLKSGMYEQNLNGLINCYIMAIPFFQNSLSGDLTYSSILFGSYYFVTSSLPKLIHKNADLIA